MLHESAVGDQRDGEPHAGSSQEGRSDTVQRCWCFVRGNWKMPRGEEIVWESEIMSLLTELRCFLNEEQMNKVNRIGQSMANEKGAVFMGDVVLTIFLKGLEQWEE